MLLGEYASILGVYNFSIDATKRNSSRDSFHIRESIKNPGTNYFLTIIKSSYVKNEV